ncbi:Odorant receptor 350 [Nylanderia fulva]|uniref:Odorant receptor n=1 Tax=Nylanderia fulva TaxID=613905 RepID=A0A6G1LQ11_9HYME|nr:Odorant receptor 350 [Nylanderia fulva]
MQHTRIIEEHYYVMLHILLLKVFGIWPHDKSRLLLLQRVLIIILNVTFICMQLLVLITSRYNLVLFVKTMSFVLPFTIIAILYCSFILKSKNIKNLHYIIQEDWKIIRNKIESEIIQKYAHYGQFYVTLIFLYTCFVIIAIIIIQFYPIIFDLISPLDEPRPCKLIIGLEYFVPQDKYFITKALHELISAIICGLIMLTTATQMLIFIVHSIGMFKIASYRVRYSLEDSVLYMSNMEKERAIYESIMQIVIAHRKAMKSSDVVISIFNVPVSIIAILAVLSLSTNLFRVGIIYLMIYILNFVRSRNIFCFITIHLVVLFAASLIGQKVMDYNNEIFRLIYCTSWYLMPVPSQKLILFLMQKAGKEFELKIGLIFVGKMENFTMLLNHALSYVTVMYSVQ